MPIYIGKTIQAIATASFYQDKWPCLVLCPSSLRLTWKAELQKWLQLDDDSIQVIFAVKDKIQTSADFIICSYDLVHRDNICAQLNQKKFKFIIADESHYVKNKDVKRSRTLILPYHIINFLLLSLSLISSSNFPFSIRFLKKTLSIVVYQ